MWCCRMSYEHFVEPAKKDEREKYLKHLEYTQTQFIYKTIMGMDMREYARVLPVAIMSSCFSPQMSQFSEDK